MRTEKVNKEGRFSRGGVSRWGGGVDRRTGRGVLTSIIYVRIGHSDLRIESIPALLILAFLFLFR